MDTLVVITLLKVWLLRSMKWVDSTSMVQTWMRTLAVVLVSKGTTLLSARNTILLILALMKRARYLATSLSGILGAFPEH